MKKVYYKIILISLTVLSFTFKTYGQDDNQNILEKPNSIIFAPFNLLDPINPSFQLGYERMLNTKWALQIEGGYIINKGLINILLNPQEKEDEYSNKGYKLRLEIKRTLVGKKRIKVYTSCELFYLKNVSEVINQFIVSDIYYDYSFDISNELIDGYENNGREIEYDDYFTNDKTKYGANVKCGLKVFTGPVFFETYLGLGIAYRQNKHSNRENINDKPSFDNFLEDNIQGEKWIFNLPANIKVGYRF